MSANEFSSTPYHECLNTPRNESRTVTIERKYGDLVTGKVLVSNPTECLLRTEGKKDVNIAIDNVAGVRNK